MLRHKIGQLIAASLDGPTLDAPARAFLLENQIGNVVLFGNNILSRAQCAVLAGDITEAIRSTTGILPLICVDHEGGRVLRFGRDLTAFPPAMALGAADDPALAHQVGVAMGRELRAAGIALNFAPVLDINTNPQNPVIGARAFGDDPARVAALGTALAAGLMEGGVLACGKHFPGHGDTAVDSHFGLPVVDRPLAALEVAELLPYRRAIADGLPAVMTSHIVFPQVDDSGLPATLSPRILQGVLRGMLGFDGLIVSDGMHMRAIADAYGVPRGCVLAVKAGVDLLCLGTGGAGFMASQAACIEALAAAVESGELPMARVDDAYKRVQAAKARAAALDTALPDWEADQALARAVAEAAVTVLRPGGPYAGTPLCVGTQPLSRPFGLGEGDQRTQPPAAVAAAAMGGVTGWDAPHDWVAVFVHRPDAEARALIDRARATGRPTAVVLMAAPYGADALDGKPTLCVYGDNPVCVRAACQALKSTEQERIP